MCPLALIARAAVQFLLLIVARVQFYQSCYLSCSRTSTMTASGRVSWKQCFLPVMHRHDVLVKMPTGGGKTICMFVPPLATSDTAMGLVISPLVALMEQQVRLQSNISNKNKIVVLLTYTLLSQLVIRA